MTVVDARSANARNNADHQQLRFERWNAVRDAAWGFVEPLLHDGCSILVVGAGNGDDLPLARMCDIAGRVTLVDIDDAAIARCTARLTDAQHARIDAVTTDVTGGAVDHVLGSVHTSWWRPRSIDPPRTALTESRHDVVLADMLYTQLLHPGLIALGLTRGQQTRAMSRYDAVLRDALIARLHASARPGGVVAHIHDVACWTRDHPQPIALDLATADPDGTVDQLRRHDACDPLHGERRMGALPTSIAWWPWNFEPNTSYLVRACSVPARST